MHPPRKAMRGYFLFIQKNGDLYITVMLFICDGSISSSEGMFFG